MRFARYRDLCRQSASFLFQDSSIVSLVNLSQNVWDTEHKQSHAPIAKKSRANEDLENGQKSSSGEEDEETVKHKASLSGVEARSF